jgi:hypothetical protein
LSLSSRINQFIKPHSVQYAVNVLQISMSVRRALTHVTHQLAAVTRKEGSRVPALQTGDQTASLVRSRYLQFLCTPCIKWMCDRDIVSVYPYTPSLNLLDIFQWNLELKVVGQL